MGFIGGLVRSIWKATLLTLVFVFVVLLIPGLPPYTSFTAIELAPTKPREGILTPNNALNNVKKFGIDKLVGPEAFQVHNGELYTGLATGEIVKLSPGGHVTFVTKIGQPCEGLWQEHKCGRPLGFQIDEAGKYIYIADAYYGIWKVDLKTDKKQLLVSPNVNIEGAPPKLFNAVALAKNGDIYWTDSSSDYQLKDGSYTTFSDPSGRLLHYIAAKNQSRVLINGLWFANGVAISPTEEFVIVNECLSSRTHRVYINGPKKGQKDIFVDGLPGIVDNIQPLPDKSGVLIALYSVFDDQHPIFSRSISRFPLLRKFLARLHRLIEMPFEYVHGIFPNFICEKIVHTIGHFSSVAALTPKSSGIVKLDWNGNIVGAWFSQDGSAPFISDAIVYQDLLYLGSPNNPYLATLTPPVELKKSFNTKTAKAAEKPKPIEPPVVKKTVEHVKETPKPAAKPITEKPPVAKPVKATETKPAQEKVIKPAAAKQTSQNKKADTPQENRIEVLEEKQAKPIETQEQEPTIDTRSKPKGPKPSVATEKPTERPSVKPATEKPTAKTATEKPTAKTATEKPIVKPASEKPIVKPVTEKPVIKPATEKPIVKPATEKPVTEKPLVAKPVELPKAAVKESAKSAPPKKETPKPTQKPEQIPIKEDIHVDTARPAKESLKVIKRDGPAEIPHPEL